MKRTKGFTLVELLVVVAIIALLVSILLPTLGRAKEMARQALCSANLNGIGKGFIIYQAENNDQTPWIRVNSWGMRTGTFAQSLTTPTTFLAPTALMFMLVRSGQPVDLFRCPSDENASKMETTKFTNASDGKTYYYWDFCDSQDTNVDTGIASAIGAANNCKKISYSLQAPLYSGTTSSAGWTSSSRGGLAIMADKTPEFDKTADAATTPKAQIDWTLTTLSDADRKRGMSQNHGSGDFISVLYADAHVGGFKRADVGISKDNIYSGSGTTALTQQGPGELVPANHVSPDDSYLIGPNK